MLKICTGMICGARALAGVVPMALAVVAGPCHAEMIGEAAVVSSTETTALLRFTDGSGDQRFVSVARDSVDDDWRATGGIPPQRGIVFGNPHPRLPGIAQLRDRGIEPSDVVKPFSLAIADETFDDLTVYRVTDDEFAIALQVDGLVTSIYYAGQFIGIVMEAKVGMVPYCEAFQSSCCHIAEVGDPLDDDNPVKRVPMPYLPACQMAIGMCGSQVVSDACDSLTNACNCGWDDSHPAHDHCKDNNNNAQACIDHCWLCDPGCPPDSEPSDGDDDDDDDIDQDLREILDLLEKILDMLAV